MAAESPLQAFDFTDYYNEELGEGIERQYIAFERLINPEEIGRIKRLTIKLEARLSVAGKRRVNIDPGYVALDKMVLATTKDATYRVYLGKGIYAQSTLYFQQGSYRHWEWTYSDYQSQMAIDFFNQVRAQYKKSI